MFSACGGEDQQEEQRDEQPTEQQIQMEAEGWQRVTPAEDITEAYGMTPRYGIKDQCFTITVGHGFAVAVKLMDTVRAECIRYVYVPEDSTVTVQDVPSGVYRLKLAYGRDWMELRTDSSLAGKFTREARYERSVELYDFRTGDIDSSRDIQIWLNSDEADKHEHFETEEIDEEEFMK